jgi:hypothetical protein
LPEREVSSLLLLSSPQQATKREHATTPALQHFFFVITGTYDIIEGELEKIFYSRTAHHARI